MRDNLATVLPIGDARRKGGPIDEEASPPMAAIQNMITNGETQQAQIAKEAGLSAAALSSWLKGTYKGDNKAVEEKLSIWLAARDRKERSAATFPQFPAWVATPTANKIMNILAYAQMAGDVAVIYGGAGLGKTYTHEEYQRRNPNVWLVTMTADTAHIAAALEEIAETIGLRGIPGRAARLRRELVRKFRGTKGLLIIDEAQHLSVNALESIRAIHDATGMGLVLSGNEYVFARLTGGSRAATFAQLFSRLGKKLRLLRPDRTDAAAVLDAIQPNGEQERKALSEIALKDGALRVMVKAWRLATLFALSEGRPVDLNHIQAAWRDLGGTQ